MVRNDYHEQVQEHGLEHEHDHVQLYTNMYVYEHRDKIVLCWKVFLIFICSSENCVTFSPSHRFRVIF